MQQMSVALYLCWSWWYPSGNRRCSNIWKASLPGAGYGQFEHKADSHSCKFKKRAERSEIDVWAGVPRLSPLWLSASSSACHGLLIITIDNATYKAQRDKNARELKLADTGNYWHADASAWCAALDAKYTKLADAKAENDALRDDVAAGRRQFAHQSESVNQCVKPPPPPAWIMQPPRLADTAERDYFAPERGWSLCKNNWKEPRSILMSSADDFAISSGRLMQLLWAIHALPAEYKCLK